MKTLFIPIDFSKNSNKSLDYAVMLARRFNFKITILHIVDLEDMQKEGNPVSAIHHLDTLQKEAQTKCGQIISRLENENIHASSIIKTGNVRIELAKLVEEYKPYMLVISTKGRGAVIDKLIGNTARFLINNVNIPILLIPEQAYVVLPKHIALASDFKPVNKEDILEPVFMLAGELTGNISIIHIETPHEKGIVGFDELQKQFSERTIKTNIVIRENQDILQGIDQYLIEEQVDLLCVIERHNKFLYRLFHKEITRKLALHSKIPTLIVDDSCL